MESGINSFNQGNLNQKQKIKSEKEEKWEKERLEVDRLADGVGYGIEEGIKEAVIALRVSGIMTDQSCEGHLNNEEEGGESFPWIRVYAPEPEGWDGSDGEEKKRMEKEWKIENLKQQKLVMDLLEEFYEKREVEFDARLNFRYVGIFGGFILQSFGGDMMELLSPEEKKEKFNLYKKEMKDFTEFLKNKYFSSNIE